MYVGKVTYVTDLDELLVVACSHDNVSVFGSEALKATRDRDNSFQTDSRQLKLKTTF